MEIHATFRMSFIIQGSFEFFFLFSFFHFFPLEFPVHHILLRRNQLPVMSSLVEKKPYSYVFIPCSSSSSSEQLAGDGSGGLNSDDLIRNAKTYFSASATQASSPSQRAAMAATIRAQAVSGACVFAACFSCSRLSSPSTTSYAFPFLPQP